MIKGIVFDLDGTLLNTIKDINVSINKTLTAFGYLPINCKQTKRSVGYGSKKLVRNVLPANTTADVKHQMFHYYLKTYDEISGLYTKPYRGIIKLVNQLKSEGYKLAIASNKSDHLVKELNDKIFNNIFDVAMGVKEGMLPKPHPQMVSETLKIMGIKNNETLYVGDTEVDIRTANNSKVKMVSVTWGFRNSDELRLLHPNYVIDRPRQLINVLKKLNV